MTIWKCSWKEASVARAYPFGGTRMGIATLCALLALLFAPCRLWGDQVEMQNGDRYVGKVLSLTTNMLVLQSESLGKMQLARDKIASITLGAGTTSRVARLPSPTNGTPRALAVARTNTPAELPAGFRQLAANTNLVQSVTAPVLGDAGPEAKEKFNELLGGLLSGKLTVNDIRVQASSAVEQMKSLKHELGDDAGVLDGYLAILEKFLGETAPAASAVTNAPNEPRVKKVPSPTAP